MGQYRFLRLRVSRFCSSLGFVGVTLTDKFLAWPPVLWTLRIAILLGLVAASWVGFLYVLRYLKPANIKALASGKLPRIRSIELLGKKVELQSERSEEMEVMLDSLSGRVAQLEQKHHEQSKALEAIAGSQEKHSK